MAFLVDTDYKAQVKDDILAMIIENTNSLRTDAELKTEAQITGYLRIRGYNTGAIFGASGIARNAHLVMIYIDMVLYHLHSRISPGQVPVTRSDRYSDAIKWLEMVSQGSLAPDLPVLALDDNGINKQSVVVAGSGTPRNHYY
jgi:hypothetical protein